MGHRLAAVQLRNALRPRLLHRGGRHPLAAAQAIDAYRPPDPPPGIVCRRQELLDRHKAEYYIVGVTVTTIFETAWALRGLSQLLMDFAADPDLAQRMLDIPFHYHLTAAKRLVTMGVDMIWTGDDVATQRGMMISPAAWRTFLKPRMARFIAELKAINPQVKVAYHCDGDLRAIIPELIEIGVDVLNPIQPACMDPAEIKRLRRPPVVLGFAGRAAHAAVWHARGGAPRGVYALETIGRNGGLILGPTHHVQLDTPLENFWAMHETILRTPCEA